MDGTYDTVAWSDDAGNVHYDDDWFDGHMTDGEPVEHWPWSEPVARRSVGAHTEHITQDNDGG
jgi:hypothetical protein